MTTQDPARMRSKYTVEVRNLAVSNAVEGDIEPLLEHCASGPFWDCLERENLTLAISREYEHFIMLVGAAGGRPHVSALELPHPSGLFYDTDSGELIVSSTRTPNQVFWFRPLSEADFESEVVPADFARPDGQLFLPYRSTLLPGTLYIHDIALIKGELYATITGHNFLARLDAAGGWKRVWWPKAVDGMGRTAFDQNYLQLNSIAVSDSPETSYYTAFSDETSGPKPWKAGYGPKGRGVVFDGRSRDVILRDLTCPHSAKLRDGRVWLCNSGYGEIGYFEPGASQPEYASVAKVNGFTRGLAFHGDLAFVGLSKVIDFYEPYAPGLTADRTVCGVAVVDVKSGEVMAQLTWPEGYQIYDVQIMPDVSKALLPRKPSHSDDINRFLRYLG